MAISAQIDCNPSFSSKPHCKRILAAQEGAQQRRGLRRLSRRTHCDPRQGGPSPQPRERTPPYPRATNRNNTRVPFPRPGSTSARAMPAVARRISPAPRSSTSAQLSPRLQATRASSVRAMPRIRPCLPRPSPIQRNCRRVSLPSRTSDSTRVRVAFRHSSSASNPECPQAHAAERRLDEREVRILWGSASAAINAMAAPCEWPTRWTGCPMERRRTRRSSPLAFERVARAGPGGWIRQ